MKYTIKHKRQGMAMKDVKSKTTKARGDLVKLFMLLVTISGAYCTYVVIAGTEGIIPKIMAAPLAVWLTAVLLKQFLK